MPPRMKNGMFCYFAVGCSLPSLSLPFSPSLALLGPGAGVVCAARVMFAWPNITHTPRGRVPWVNCRRFAS